MLLDKPIIALDVYEPETLFRFLDCFGDEELNVKVGMELFYANGPVMVRELKARGHHIFLDLKLHDIPNTVAQSLAALTRLGVDMLNVHATGGSEMMRWGMEAIKEVEPDPKKRPLLIAVTQLTSTSEEQMQREQMTTASISESVLNYAQLTQKAGLDGVVCSPHEVEMLKSEVGSEFLTVTPGIRPANYQAKAKEDQKRITTPQKARQLGSDYIVVGRPITQAEDPQAAYHAICKDWQEA